MSKRGIASCAAVAVLALTGCGSTGITAAPTRCTNPKGEQVAVWIGDSYTAGTGAASADDGYACKVSRELGWAGWLDAQRSTGFLADGHKRDHSYSPLPARLPATAKAHPDADIVIIDAGRNDTTFPALDLRAAVKDYLGDVRVAWPNARVVVILPWIIGGKPDQAIAAQVVESEARAAGAVVVPLGESALAAHPQAADDGVHPSGDGHDKIAGRLRELLKGLA